MVQVTGDVRLITSSVFKTRYSMRFPKANYIREDKSPYQVQTEDELINYVNQKHGEGAFPSDNSDHIAMLTAAISGM